MSSASTPLRQPLPAVEADPEMVCEWTDEELEAMGDESMAEPGDSIDGPTFAREFLAETRKLADEAIAARR